jgi:hypothetical protein
MVPKNANHAKTCSHLYVVRFTFKIIYSYFSFRVPLLIVGKQKFSQKNKVGKQKCGAASATVVW